MNNVIIMKLNNFMVTDIVGYKISLTIFLFTLIVGCINNDERKSSHQNDISIISSKTEDPKSFISDIRELRFIPLKAHPKAYLSTIRKIVYHKDYFIILCYNRTPIYFYDHNGNYKFNISSSGQGPLELSSCIDIALYNDETLLISDNEKSSILSYNLISNTITEEWKLELPAFSIECFNNDIILISNDPSEGNIKVVRDFDFSRILSYGKGGKHFNKIVSIDPFEVWKGKLFINVGFTDTIYMYRNREIVPSHVLGDENTTMLSLSDDQINNAVFLKDLSDKVKSKYIPQGTFSSINDKWIIPMFWAKDFLIYHPETGKTYKGNEKSVDNLKLWVNGLYPRIYASDGIGGYFSYVMPDARFYNYVEETKEKGLFTNSIFEEVEKLRGLDFENPIITYFKVGKNFLNVQE